ncbi:MAG: tRNA-uridine aminocarboxypropyltransferase [Myxococcota bacterium]|nr:tRNA-uridine aminocarboxypropyltransferase [Myxococcota bacterium]
MSLYVPRCERCWLHQPLCICAEVVAIESRTSVSILSHFKELGRNSNSARLIPLCLRRGRMFVRGIKGRVVPSEAFMDDGRQSLILYPSEDARCISEFAKTNCPFHLIVPDGNWRQARRIMKREPRLRDVPIVRLPDGPPSSFRLRRQSHAAHVSTCEAVARALGILEGESLQQHLERAFHMMVGRTLWSRGLLSADKVCGGIPARAHHPTLARGESPGSFRPPSPLGGLADKTDSSKK